MTDTEEKLTKKKLKKEKKEKKEKKSKKKDEKKEKKSKRKREDETTTDELLAKKGKDESDSGTITGPKSKFSFPIQYILAPMVGASELPFRLLCRKYGTQAAYTPMMSSTMFASDAQYRKEEFQTIPEDRPLVCHFSANDPKEFTNAAKLVQDKCDAIDLNLGCPQRTAYLEHFGSYLLEPEDRELICDIVRMASRNVSVPIFVKIRLLNTIEDTIQLCQQLKDAGASLIAIHARYRASFERKGAGARDGAAKMDHILKVREALGPDFPLIANGNVITFDDVESNMRFTKSDGVMSAEGILDNPALYLPRHGEDGNKVIQIKVPTPLNESVEVKLELDGNQKKIRKLTKKLREIEAIEAKAASGEDLSKDQTSKLATKKDVTASVSILAAEDEQGKPETDKVSGPKTAKIALKDLQLAAEDATILANEYIDLTIKYPTKMRTVIFHTRRILKSELNKYQLMEECVASKTIEDLRELVTKVSKYLKDPSLFHFDKAKAQKEKDAMERKKREEGKRKAYEARMMRKAKREGKADLEFYLRQGAQLPTVEEVQDLKKRPKDEQMSLWKSQDHSQHCMAFHMDECKRDRTCAFLHADARGVNAFAESDEVAG